MNRLILVKHSMPQIVEDTPPRTWQLSAAGRERCVPLADKLVVYQPGLIVTSDEPKAAETGRIVAGILRVPCATMPDLHEQERTGEPFTTAEEFERKMKAFFAAPSALIYGNETADAAGARFSGAVGAILRAYPDQDVVVVAHGTVITLFVAQHNRIEPFGFWKQLKLPSFVVLSLPDMQAIEVVEDAGK